MIIEDEWNKWTNHQQRTTSTINEIVLMKTGIEDEKMVERVEDDESGKAWKIE